MQGFIFNNLCLLEALGLSLSPLIVLQVFFAKTGCGPSETSDSKGARIRDLTCLDGRWEA